MRELRIFLRLMGPHRLWLLAGSALAFITLASGIALLTLSGWFITASALTGLGGAAAIMAFNVLIPGASIRALALIRVVSRYGERLVTHEATFRILARLRAWFFARAIPLSPGQLASVRSGDMLSRITSDIDALDILYLRFLTPVAVAVLAGLLFLATAALFSVTIAATAIAVLVLAGGGVPLLALKLGAGPGKTITQQTSRLRTRLLDALHGLKELISYGVNGRYLDLVADESDRLLAARERMSHITGLASALTLFGAHLVVIAVLVLGIPLVAGDTMGPAVLALLVFLGIAAFEIIAPLSPAFQGLSRTHSAARRILGLAHLAPLTPDPPKGEAAIPNGDEIRIEGASFNYPGAPRAALSGIDLTLEPGSWTALVGASGSGKTSLLNLCLRYYDPAEGKITLGGADIKHMARASLWRRIGYLSQRTELFSATIRDNIMLGRATADEAALDRAVRLSGLKAFIDAQPDGLDTWVGEDGVLVSGGQARRIALARVILKDAPILLLDEPTEGLDAETEAQILEALRRFAEDKTVLLVTHRESLLSGVSAVFHMEDGRLSGSAPGF